MSGTWDLHASIHEVVNSIQSEIDALVQQKADLARIRMNMWRRFLAFKTETNPSRGDRTRRGSKRQHSAAERASAHKSRSLNRELWRACRIAIMEVVENPTAKQIYSQIVRRGSFNFDGLKENPISAIARTLTVMSGCVGDS